MNEKNLFFQYRAFSEPLNYMFFFRKINIEGIYQIQYRNPTINIAKTIQYEIIEREKIQFKMIIDVNGSNFKITIPIFIYFLIR